jgi:hypothetical protein
MNLFLLLAQILNLLAYNSTILVLLHRKTGNRKHDLGHLSMRTMSTIRPNQNYPILWYLNFCYHHVATSAQTKPMNKVIISHFFKKPIDHGMKNAESNTHHLKNTKSEWSAAMGKCWNLPGVCRWMQRDAQVRDDGNEAANKWRSIPAYHTHSKHRYGLPFCLVTTMHGYRLCLRLDNTTGATVIRIG